MTLEEKVLRADRRNHYTEHDIKRHLKDGVRVFASIDEFRESFDPAERDDEEEILSIWNAFDEVEVEGKTYRYDVVL